MCLHARHVCDGWPQCPQRDDELFCDLTCPENCTCHGLAFFCASVVSFAVHSYPDLRYLDARGSGFRKHHLDQNLMLIHLSLARCRVRTVDNFTFPNLHSLDLSDNLILVVRTGQLKGMKWLRVLFLAGNPLTTFFAADPSAKIPPFFTAAKLQTLDLSRVNIQALDLRVLSSQLPNMETLNLSNCGVEELLWSSDSGSSRLRVLDIRGCPLTAFPRDTFKGLTHLQQVQADNFKLCCPAVLPDGFKLNQCFAPVDAVSTCDSLIGSGTFRVAMALLAVSALLGNLVVFVARVGVQQRAGGASSCGVFVAHLSVADFGMGAYLGVIGTADRVFRGAYAWEDARWRSGAACRAAGFLYAVTSQASTLILGLLVLDRVLLLLPPLRHRGLRFGVRSAHAASSVAWGGSFLLAAVPLLAPRWGSLYTHQGTCSPLPLAAAGLGGQEDYALGVFVAFNFTIVLLIAAGLAFVRAAKSSKRTVVSLSDAGEGESSADMDTSYLLPALGVSRFLSRCFADLVAMLVSLGYPVADDISVGSALVVVPLSSALSPVLHALSAWLQRRQRAVEERLLKRLARRTQGLRAKTVASASTALTETIL